MKIFLFVAVMLLFCPATIAYNIRMDKDLPDANRWFILADSYENELKNIGTVWLVSRPGWDYKGFFVIGGRKGDIIILNTAFFYSDWDFGNIMGHELGHHKCWRAYQDISEGCNRHG